MKRCAKTRLDTDSENYQIPQVEYMGKLVDAEDVHIYGLSSNSPIDSLGVLFGDSDSYAAIFSYQPERFKNLKEWEVQIGNFKTKSSIKFAENADIEIDAKAGKFIIKNDDEELITWLEEFVTALTAMTTSTAIGPQPPINIATFTDLKTRIAKLKGA